jgi:GNAT superfamily N-acetyltransferase
MRVGDIAREHGSGAGRDTDRDLVIERVTTREVADRWHQIAQECFAADYYQLPADPVQEIYERIESTRSDDQYELWLGCLNTGSAIDEGIAGVPVVVGELRLPLLDNVENAVVNVCTRPAFRQRGHGTAMLHHLTARARAQGRTRLIGQVAEPMPLAAPMPLAGSTGRARPSSLDASRTPSPAPPPGVLFATNARARPVTSEVRRVLRIGDLDDAELARLQEDAGTHSVDYSLVQWEGRAPAEIIDDLVVLHSRMTIDAPLEELDWEPEQWTHDRYREREKRIIAGGQVCLSTAARHNSSGQIVALTDIGLTVAQTDIAYQWATIVLPSHRGHRLGMLVKLANLEFLRASRPHVQTLNTWNAAINDHMVAINEAIGFRPVERWREWQLELSNPTT